MAAVAAVVAVLGTGVIGYPVARNMASGGIEVRAWNRTREKAAGLADDGVLVAETPEEAARGADVVLTVLKDGPAALDAVRRAAPAPGTAWVQMGTAGEGTAACREHARAAGLVFVDAPVLGTRAPAEAGQLTVLATGPESVRPLLDPVFATIAARALWVPDASALKLVLNTWVLSLTTGVGEMLSLASALGVDAGQVLEVLSGGPLDCGYLRSKSKAVLEGDLAPSFTVDNAAKDAGLIVAAAASAGVTLDATEAARARLHRASAQGRGGEDLVAAYYASFPGGVEKSTED